jgi:hypothetical protein
MAASGCAVLIAALLQTGVAKAQETITVPCSRVDDFIRGEIDVPPGARVVVSAHTLRSLVEQLGAESVARLMMTPEGRAAMKAKGLITDEEFEWCKQRVQSELTRRQRDRAAASSLLAIIPFVPGQPIYVDAQVNDAIRARLILDTGADTTLIAPRLLRAAGASLRPDGGKVRGIGGRLHVDLYDIESLQVGKARARRLTIVGHDFDDSRSDGLLGRDFLDQFTVVIDNNARRVTVSPK